MCWSRLAPSLRASLPGRRPRRAAALQRCFCAAQGKEAEEALARAELAKRAHREVQIARRRRREADDEFVLWQSASAAGFPCRDEDGGDEPQRRRQAVGRFLAARAEEIVAALAAQRPLSEIADFSLEVALSRDLPQPIAGNGVFIKEAKNGEVPAGTLLAFYPGTVYMPHEVRWCGGHGPLMGRAGQPTSSHVIGRVGGVLIDGLWSGFEVPAAEFDLDDEALGAAVSARCEKENVSSDAVRDAARADAEAFCHGLRSEARRAPSPHHGGSPERVRALNPLAVGEMINHPPEGGRSANVMGWPVDLNLEGRGHLAPNTFALRPEGGEAPGAPCPYTVVMVAARTLRPGDELYLDYGCELLEKDDIPVWFTPASLRGDAKAEDPAASPAIAVQNELHAWRASFERAHGRKPTRHDLASDKVASALFDSFQKYRKLGEL